MRGIVFILFSLLLLNGPLQAQNTSFTASTDAKEVTTQTVFQVTFTLQNARGSNFQPPDFKCFDYVSGPSTEMSTTIINGAMSQTMGYSYNLMRSKPGTCTIGPATIRVGNQLLSSNSLTIQVVKGKPRPQNNNQDETASDQDVFIRAVLSSNPVYPGQQVRLDYKVYTTVSVRNYNTLSEDNYDQFYYRYIQDFRKRAQLEVIDGVQYTVQTIKSLALFPQQTGDFTIDPMVATLGLSLKSARPNFFFGTPTVPKTVASDSLVVHVLPLPPGAPATFNGAVGHYQMQASVNKQQLSTDDALVLTLDITGDGDPRRWSPPDLTYLQKDYELYDPRVLRDDTNDKGGSIQTRRTIEYLMIPREAGQRTLQVGFTYFDPDSAVYRTLSTQPFALSVSQGTHASHPETVFSADVGSQKLHDFKPISGGSGFLLLFSPLYFALLAIPSLGVAGVWWVKRRQDLFEALDPAEKKRRRARKIAEQHLQEAQKNLQGEERAFYDSLSRAIYSYLSAKLKMPVLDLTKHNITAQLERLDLPSDLRDEVMQILTISEQVLYAGGTSQADRQKLYDRTLAMIETVEGRVGLK